MLLVSRYIHKMPKNITCSQFMKGVTAYIRKHYKKSMLPRLAEHSEDRLTASVIVFSRLQREIWMIGDCQCLLIDGEHTDADVQFIDNPKPAEAELAKMRAEEVKRQLADGKTVDDLLQNDTARPVIIPRMIETMRQQARACFRRLPIPLLYPYRKRSCPTTPTRMRPAEHWSTLSSHQSLPP